MADNKPKSFAVRRAKAEDVKYVHQMIQELADNQNMSHGPKITAEDLIRDAGLDGGTELIHCYIVEENDASSEANETKPIGYAICFFSYSTWQGKSYFLEDIFIKPEYRARGVGAMLFKEVVTNAKTLGCKRVDFHVLGWNPARKFYNKMGATDLTESEDWHFYRLHEDAIGKLVNQ